MAEESHRPTDQKTVSPAVESPVKHPLRERVFHLASKRDDGAVEISAQKDQALSAFLATSDRAEALVAWFGTKALKPDTRSIRVLLDRDIAAIDSKISEQLEKILDQERLRDLERVWRGVRWLIAPIRRRGPQNKIIVRILDASKAEVARDLSRSPEFDQSQTFQKIYNEEFGMAGGRPFGLIVTDYDVSHRPSLSGVDDVTLLRDLSKVASTSFCPIILSANPSLFGVNTIRDLSRRENIRSTFEQTEFTRFRSFQSTSDARFMGIAVGGILARSAYSSGEIFDSGFVYCGSRDHGGGGDLFVPGAFTVAHVVIRAFANHAWPAAMRGAPARESRDDIAGGVISPIFEASFATDRPNVGSKISLEASLSERQESQLNSLGFLAVRPCPYTEYSAIYNAPSMHLVKSYSEVAANQNARISAMLNYLLCACRFAHYVKVIARDWVGSYKTAKECQLRLQKWISSYCIASEETGYSERARFPLRRAQISVEEMLGRPGYYGCNIQLEPHFQLDYVVSEFELSTVLDAGSEAA